MKKQKFAIAAIVTALVFGMFAAYCSAAKNNAMPKIEKEFKKMKTELHQDFDKAIADAKKEEKIVMLEFTGSQWCPPCKMFHKYILDSKKFGEYIENKIKFVMADFERGGAPISKEFGDKHSMLAKQFEIEAFPTIVLINPKTNVITKIQGLPTTNPDEMIEMIEQFKIKSDAMTPAAAPKTAAPKVENTQTPPTNGAAPANKN